MIFNLLPLGDTLAIETSLSKGTDERDSTIESQGPSAPRVSVLHIEK